MSKKGYTKVEREQVGRDLLTVGLEMLSQRGLKGTTLQDILQAEAILLRQLLHFPGRAGHPYHRL